jgi:bifunctional DNase/RNase
MVEMTIQSVRINLATQQRVVILKARNQERYLFIWIAHAEAYAIAVELQGIVSPRPLTHDLLKHMLEGLGAKVARVVVADIVDDIFYTRITLDVNGKELEFDARPSDGFALAVRTKTPVFVEEHVLERAGVSVDDRQNEETVTDLFEGPLVSPSHPGSMQQPSDNKAESEQNSENA